MGCVDFEGGEGLTRTFGAAKWWSQDECRMNAGRTLEAGGREEFEGIWLGQAGWGPLTAARLSDKKRSAAIGLDNGVSSILMSNRLQ